MLVLSIQRGEAVELLACSNDSAKLHARMKEEVLGFLSEVYGNDEEAFEWLIKGEPLRSACCHGRSAPSINMEIT